jgi:hypothetical protein
MTNKIDIKQNISTAKFNHQNITFNKLVFQSTNTAVINRVDFGFLPWHSNKQKCIQTAMFRLRSGDNKLNPSISMLEPETLGDCPTGFPELQTKSKGQQNDTNFKKNLNFMKYLQIAF